MRQLLVLILGVGLLTAVGTASASPVGLAESKGRFEIQREGVGAIQRANGSAVVQTADRLVASERMLRVQATNGEAIALEESGSLAWTGEEALSLEKGSLAVSMPKTSNLNVSFSGLSVLPLAASSTNDTRMLVVTYDGANRASITSVRDAFVVRSAETGEQLAVLSEGDAMEFVQRDGGWLIAPSRIGAARMQDGAGEGVDSEIEEDEDDEKKGWLWFGTGAAVAAGVVGVGVLGYVIYDEVTDDDDDDDDDDDFFFPSSPVVPPDEGDPDDPPFEES